MRLIICISHIFVVIKLFINADTVKYAILDFDCIFFIYNYNV